MFNSSRFATKRIVEIGTKWKYGDTILAGNFNAFEGKINNIESTAKSYSFGSNYQDFTLWNIAYKFKTQLASIKGDVLSTWHYPPVTSLRQFLSYSPNIVSEYEQVDEYKNRVQLVIDSTVEINFNSRPDDIVYYPALNRYYFTFSSSNPGYTFYEYKPETGQVTGISQLRYYYAIKIVRNGYLLYIMTKYGNVCVVDPRNGFSSAQFYSPPYVSGPTPTPNFQTNFHNIVYDGRYIYFIPVEPRSRISGYYSLDYLVFDTQTLAYTWVQSGQLYSHQPRPIVANVFLGYDGYIYFRDNYASPNIVIYKCKGTSNSVYSKNETIDTYLYGTIIQLPSGKLVVPYQYNGAKVYKIVSDSLVEVDSKPDSVNIGHAGYKRICNFICGWTTYSYVFYRPKLLEELNFVVEYLLSKSTYNTIGQLSTDKIYLAGYDTNKVLYSSGTILKGW